jgi:ketosteroid isomerase-like protein
MEYRGRYAGDGIDSLTDLVPRGAQCFSRAWRAMTQENVEAVRRLLETSVRPNFSDAELEQLFHPDVHLDLTVREVNPATYDGYGGVRQFVRDLFEIWDEWNFMPPFELLPGEDDRVLAVYTISGRGRSSGVAVEMQVYNVFTVRAGRVVRMKSCRDRSAAFEAAGFG